MSSSLRCGSLDGNADPAAKPSPTIRPFVLPYKRFATPCLIERTKRFLRNPKVDYRESVKNDRQRIGYAPEQEDSLDSAPSTSEQLDSEQTSFHQPIVDHSLIWRTATWLGSLTGALTVACRMILQRNPNALSHRFTPSIDPTKARSELRLNTLETAEHLLHVVDQWEEIFGEKFFPRFATRSGFD